LIPDPSPPFEFEPSGAIRDRIAHLLTEADKRGVLAEAAAAFHQIVRWLIRRPRKWGDPIRNLRHAQVTVYRGIHWDLACQYGVHDRVPIVFLSDIRPLPDNPLYGL
jgi:hypothetical protein